MGTTSQPGQTAEYSRILQRCRRCGRETPHEIHATDGMNIKVCVCCVERALMYELDRD